MIVRYYTDKGTLEDFKNLGFSMKEIKTINNEYFAQIEYELPKDSILKDLQVEYKKVGDRITIDFAGDFARIFIHNNNTEDGE